MSSIEPFERLRDTHDLRTPTQRKRLLVIVNPYATTVSANLRQLVVSALTGTYDVDAVDTHAQGHATELCRAAAHDGYDLVVAFGGDGTVNEAANGLVGSQTPLACLPGGSNNVFVRMLGTPTDIVDATEHLLALSDRWPTRRIDVGHVNGRHFLFSSGVGLDAAVVAKADANPRLKARFRQTYFAWSAVTQYGRKYVVSPPQLRATLDNGDVLDGTTVIVQNGDPYTYFHGKPLPLAPGVQLDNGQLGGAVLLRSGVTVLPGLAVRAFTTPLNVSDHRAVAPFLTPDGLTVTSRDERPFPLHVDGDFLGDVAEARYGITPSALSVVA